MYSIYDPWLPFWENTDYESGRFRIIDIRSKAKSYDERYLALKESMNEVKTAYRNLIVNW